MTHDGDDWRVPLREARRAALASLTPAQEAKRAAEDKVDRDVRAARRRAKAKRALFVNQRIAHGDTPDEIAIALGMSERGLRDLAQRGGHALIQKKGCRRLAAWVLHKNVAALDGLAAEYSLTREKMLGLIVADALASGAFVARRRRRVAA